MTVSTAAKNKVWGVCHGRPYIPSTFNFSGNTTMPATALPSLDEPNAGRLTIQYCPASDEKVVENPPRFMWIPVIDEEATYVLRISSDPDFPAKTTHIFAL